MECTDSLSAASEYDDTQPLEIEYLDERQRSISPLYHPLPSRNSFRLLRLAPSASFDDTISCTFLVVEAGHEPYYQAMSHMWNREALPCQTITINSCPVGVGPIVFSALQHLRLRDKYRVLWVDALCINMSDKVETATQVGLMSHIFNNAENVCIWLGDESLKFGPAFPLLEQLLDVTNIDKILENEIPALNWKALLHLLSHPIFRRRWVIQEIALAVTATLHCGTLQMKWSDFAAAVAVFVNLNIWRATVFPYSHTLGWMGEFEGLAAPRFIDITISILRKSEAGETKRLLSLEQLVFGSALFQCEPPDVIYALVGLSNDSKNANPAGVSGGMSSDPMDLVRFEPTVFPPDSISASRQTFSDLVVSLLAVRKAIQKFRENLRQNRSRPMCTDIIIDYNKPILQIYQEFVAFAMAKSMSLGILCRPWAPVPKGPRFPSWIATTDRGPFGPNPVYSILKLDDAEPDIYVRINADPLIGPPGHETYNASGNIPARWYWGLDNGHIILSARGFILDSIHKIETKAMGGYIANEWLELGGWLDRNQEPPDQFWRTLVADRDLHTNRPPYYYRKVCHEIFRRGTSDVDTDEFLRKDVKGTPSIFTEFIRRVQRVVWNKKLIRTSRGYLGLAPASAKAGDLICILYGCSVPVILAQLAPEVPRSYLLRGDCYVHGMMDGEALSVQKEHILPSRSFNIL
jgi:hypothetical protein